MLSFSGSLKVFVAVEACDMRKGFNGLHALVAERWGCSVETLLTWLVRLPAEGIGQDFQGRLGNRLIGTAGTQSRIHRSSGTLQCDGYSGYRTFAN